MNTSLRASRALLKLTKAATPTRRLYSGYAPSLAGLTDDQAEVRLLDCSACPRFTY